MIRLILHQFADRLHVGFQRHPGRDCFYSRKIAQNSAPHAKCQIECRILATISSWCTVLQNSSWFCPKRFTGLPGVYPNDPNLATARNGSRLVLPLQVLQVLRGERNRPGNRVC